ncbi:hypothetical protein [Azospirillum sp. TSH64]|nr:hypothetical protein [Azospirillum sp. TSH64]
MLRDLACESYQGFLFSRPISVEELKRLLEKLTAVQPLSAE